MYTKNAHDWEAAYLNILDHCMMHAEKPKCGMVRRAAERDYC